MNWMQLHAATLVMVASTLPTPTNDDDWRAADGFLTDLDESEHLADLAGTFLKKTVVHGLRTMNFERVGAAFMGDAECWPGQVRPVDDPNLTVFELLPAPGEPVDAATFVNALRESVNDWVTVEHAKCKLFEFRLQPDLGLAFGAVHFDYAGTRPDGTRSRVECTMELQMRRSSDSTRWPIQKLRMVHGYRVDSILPRFVDITDATGFHWNESAEHQRLNETFVNQRKLLTLGGVSVVDWNRDGFPDLLATRRMQTAVLFLNDGQGGFRREPLPIALPHDAGYTFLYVDLDGDGLEELVSTQPQRYEGERGWLGLYTRVNDEWQHRPDALPFPCRRGVRRHSFQALNVADIDGDGDLDVFVGAHSDSDSGLDYNSFAAWDGGRNLLYLNDGELKFTEVSEERGLHGRQYTYISCFHDFDGDGDVDLLEGNDFGPNWLWTNDGRGHFTRADDHVLSGESSYTMGIALTDWDNSGRLGLYLSNMYSHAGNRIAPLAKVLSEDMRKKVAAIGRGNELYSEQADGRWVEHGHELGLNECGWAWAPVFFDLDNDGDRDLFVANGNTSHEDADAPDW